MLTLQKDVEPGKRRTGLQGNVWTNHREKLVDKRGPLHKRQEASVFLAQW